MTSFLDEAQVELGLIQLVGNLGCEYAFGPQIASALSTAPEDLDATVREFSADASSGIAETQVAIC